MLLGDAARGRDRLEAYARRPQRHDTAERVQAFLRWLEDVEPVPDVTTAHRNGETG